MTLPPVTICIVTFMRFQELRRVLKNLHLLHYEGELHILIADDSTPDDNYLPSIKNLMTYEMEWFHAANVQWQVISTPQNGGWGYNVNHAMRQIPDNHIIMLMEDDYVMTEHIDITPWVALLDQNEQIGLVRLDGIAGHNVYAAAQEFKLTLPSDYMYLETSITNPDTVFYWSIDVTSPELWIYSNRPHLKHRRFIETHGDYPEGLPLGQTESQFAHRVKDNMRNTPREERLKIVSPFRLSLPTFDHIGKSFQHTKWDK